MNRTCNTAAGVKWGLITLLNPLFKKLKNSTQDNLKKRCFLVIFRCSRRMKFHHLKSVLILSLLFVAAVTVTADDPEDEDDAVVEDAKPEEPNIPTEEKVSRLYFSIFCTCVCIMSKSIVSFRK